MPIPLESKIHSSNSDTMEETIKLKLRTMQERKLPSMRTLPLTISKTRSHKETSWNLKPGMMIPSVMTSWEPLCQSHSVSSQDPLTKLQERWNYSRVVEKLAMSMFKLNILRKEEAQLFMKEETVESDMFQIITITLQQESSEVATL